MNFYHDTTIFFFLGKLILAVIWKKVNGQARDNNLFKTQTHTDTVDEMFQTKQISQIVLNRIRSKCIRN